ncbi:MAG: universal stress protein [Methylotenera sp.]|nr:universal stress protein [Oligoflexia bacterium]
MTSDSDGKLIVWAVDPFREPPDETEELNRSAAWAIHALTHRLARVTKPQVQPLYVSELSTIPGSVLEELRTEGQETLDGIFTRVKIHGLLPFEILKQGTHNRVGQLLRFARHQDADLIVVSTHGRRGLQRWMKGSFTEDLMLQSEIPLLVVNPHWKRVPDFERILFPTDFSEASRLTLDRVTEFAGTLGSRITLFHKVSFDPAPSIEVAFGSYPTYQETYSSGVEACQNQLMDWVELLKRQGHAATYILDTSLVGTAEEAILEEAEKEPGMIAMAAQSGPVSATLLGSLTRKIVRGARTPVWILHPRLGRMNRPQRHPPRRRAA